MRSPPSAAFARIIALLVACLFGSAGLAAYVHQAWVEHAVCAEHGELVHVGENAGDERGPADSPDDPGHAHCQLGPATGAVAQIDVRALSVDAPTCGRVLALAPVRGPPARGVDLHRAPKTSPPRA